MITMLQQRYQKRQQQAASTSTSENKELLESIANSKTNLTEVINSILIFNFK